jgi:hypothetical protein
VNEIARFATGAALLLAVALVVLLLNGPRQLTLEPPPGLDRMPTADGVLTEVADDRLVLGGRTFTIEERDRPRLDLDHLRSHAADRLPVRISYEGRAARWVTDAPPFPSSSSAPSR